MFEGFQVLIPILLVMSATVGLGVIFSGLAWLAVIFGRGTKGRKSVSPALVVFSASVVSVVAGWGVTSTFPGEWESRRALGQPLAFLVVLFSLAVSLLCEILTLPLARKFPSQVNGILIVGSLVLILVNVLAVVLYWQSGPGMPLH